MSEEDKNLPFLYQTPKLHKVPFKHCFITGCSKCTTKDLSCLLTKVLTTVTDGLIRSKANHSKVSSLWIVKNSTSLLSSLDQLDVCRATATSVQTCDFSKATQSAYVSNYCTCTQLIQEERWKQQKYPH